MVYQGVVDADVLDDTEDNTITIAVTVLLHARDTTLPPSLVNVARVVAASHDELKAV
ncbi:MAG: hypothetical protein ACK56I_15685 [bacterium]